MKKSLLLAVSLLAVAALVGCSDDTTDDTQSSTNDIVTGDPRDKGTGADYGVQQPDDKPLPELEGNGADGTIQAGKLIRLPASLNVKPVLDFPKPPLEAPSNPANEQL